MRGSDVIKREGTHALLITPEAGTVKNRKARVVPLHEHLIEQGFLNFVAKHGDGPLFYTPRKSKKPPYAQARQRLADWVRSLGITDAELQPNHAWRHTFKQIADHAGITERTSNYITGHAQRQPQLFSIIFPWSNFKSSRCRPPQPSLAIQGCAGAYLFALNNLQLQA
jgi:integrase